MSSVTDTFGVTYTIDSALNTAMLTSAPLTFALEHEDADMNYGVFSNGLLVESCSLSNLSKYSYWEEKK